jgi:hypothetical protein
MDKERAKVEEKKRYELARIESKAFLENGPEEMTKLYRPFSMNQSKQRTHENRLRFPDINWAGKTMSPSKSLPRLTFHRARWQQDYFPRTHSHHSKIECQNGVHCLSPADNYHSGHSDSVQTKIGDSW